MPKRTAEQLVEEIENYVIEYLRLREKEEGLMPPMISEIRAFLNRVSGRPTSMTDLVVRRLERKGKVEVTRIGNDGTVKLVREERDDVPVTGDWVVDSLSRVRHDDGID